MLTGPLEPTNEAYAIAKISGILARRYRREYGRRWISAMPTNLYGPGDNFDLTRPCAPGDDAQVPRGRRDGDASGHVLGHRYPAARVPPRRRPGAAVSSCSSTTTTTRRSTSAPVPTSPSAS